MNYSESIEDFYKRKVSWTPANIHHDIGNFNVFRIEPCLKKTSKAPTYRRRNYFKISLNVGNNKISYADRTYEVKKQALVFSNPYVPYRWENLDKIESGFFCAFNQNFFQQHGNIGQYEVFQPRKNHVFELSDEQTNYTEKVFDKMFAEIGSEYVYKYDVLRNLVSELIHFALKMQPALKLNKQPKNASERITSLFMELLERQFPIEENHPRIRLRTAADFAEQLNIHVNHLNRAVKENTQKTTTQLIAERILQEAKVLLLHSNWNISEIAYSLGFKEATRFNYFFKKRTQISPSKFRSL